MKGYKQQQCSVQNVFKGKGASSGTVIEEIDGQQTVIDNESRLQQQFNQPSSISQQQHVASHPQIVQQQVKQILSNAQAINNLIESSARYHMTTVKQDALKISSDLLRQLLQDLDRPVRFMSLVESARHTPKYENGQQNHVIQTQVKKGEKIKIGHSLEQLDSDGRSDDAEAEKSCADFLSEQENGAQWVVYPICSRVEFLDDGGDDEVVHCVKLHQFVGPCKTLYFKGPGVLVINQQHVNKFEILTKCTIIPSVPCFVFRKSDMQEADNEILSTFEGRFALGEQGKAYKWKGIKGDYLEGSGFLDKLSGWYGDAKAYVTDFLNNNGIERIENVANTVTTSLKENNLLAGKGFSKKEMPTMTLVTGNDRLLNGQGIFDYLKKGVGFVNGMLNP